MAWINATATFFTSLLSVALVFPAVPISGAARAQETEFDYLSFDCGGAIRRQGSLLEMGERVAGDWFSKEFSCIERSCVHHGRDTNSDGTTSDVFAHVYILENGPRFVSTRTVWEENNETPVSHSSLILQPSGCLTMRPDQERWTIDLGSIRYENGEVHATPRTGINRVDYFYAPERLLGDWSNASTIQFEKKSDGEGRYLAAYYEDIYGDIVLRSGSMRASYEIPEHHTGEWRSYEVPLDGPGWTLKGGAMSVADVLQNVTGFQIRAQYGTGPNTSAIRNVVIN